MDSICYRVIRQWSCRREFGTVFTKHCQKWSGPAVHTGCSFKRTGSMGSPSLSLAERLANKFDAVCKTKRHLRMITGE